jgi:hypothetical protein
MSLINFKRQDYKYFYFFRQGFLTDCKILYVLITKKLCPYIHYSYKFMPLQFFIALYGRYSNKGSAKKL